MERERTPPQADVGTEAIPAPVRPKPSAAALGALVGDRSRPPLALRVGKVWLAVLGAASAVAYAFATHQALDNWWSWGQWTDYDGQPPPFMVKLWPFVWALVTLHAVAGAVSAARFRRLLLDLVGWGCVGALLPVLSGIAGREPLMGTLTGAILALPSLAVSFSALILAPRAPR